MTTYTDFVKGGANGFAESKRTPKYVEAVIDFADQNAVTTDRFDVFNFPVGTLVLQCSSEVITAVTGTGTITTPTYDITDGTKVWVNDEELDVVGHAALLASQTTAPETLATAAQTIRAVVTITDGGTITAGKLRVWALIVDVNEKAPATTAVL